MTAEISSMIYDPYDPHTVADPYGAYRVLRDEHPVFHNEQRGFWALSRFEDVLGAVHDPERFSSGQGVTLDRHVEPPLPMLVSLDPPRHPQLRALVSRVFNPRRIALLEDEIRAVTRACLEGRGRGDTFDLAVDLAGPLPTVVIAELLGVPASDRVQFRKWSDDSNSANPDDPDSDNRVFTAVIEIAEYLNDIVSRRRADSRDDMISHLIAADVDGETLTDDEILGFLLLLLVAGNETTAGLIGTTAINLAAHPDQRALLTKDPALVTNALEEFVRFGGSVHGLTRTATTDIVMHDTVIPEGEVVLLLYAAANRDDREFDRPDTFDITRQAKRHVGFGHGIHHCLGAALARLEVRVAFEELLSAAPDYEVDFANVEWAPSPLTRSPAHVPVRL